MIPYATLEGYRQIEALLADRYVWNEGGGCWVGGEEDVPAAGIEEVEGWRESVNGGWLCGEQFGVVRGYQMEEAAFEDVIHVEARPKKRLKSTGRGG